MLDLHLWSFAFGVLIGFVATVAVIAVLFLTGVLGATITSDDEDDDEEMVA